MKEFDVIVIGAGPGGYVAAIRAAQLGFKTAVVEKEHLGGICLNWGCIPTKALLRSSEIYHLMKNSKDFGITCKGVDFDFEAIIKRSRGVSSKLSGGIGHLMKKNKITVINGAATLEGSGTLSVGKDKFKAKHIILATGARARELPTLKPDGKNIWTYKEAMVPKKMPKSMVVVGSGAIGIEFANFYNTMGCDVTVIEVMPRILGAEDEEIAALAHKSFEKQGIKIHTNTEVLEAKASGNTVSVKVKAKDGKVSTLKVEKVISAVGVIGNVDNIGLEKTKAKLDRGFIKADGYGATDEPGLYAIGDITSPPWLAHKASHEGIVCIEKIKGLKDVHPIKKENIPGCTYCHPQIASVGLTEAKAKEAGHKVKVGRFPFMANGKAIALGDTEGMIKTVFNEKTGELLGAHMIGSEVTELIQGFVIGKTMECTELDLMHTIFPHPTLSEMMHESVLDAYGKVVHI